MEYYIKAKELMDMEATGFSGGVSEREVKHAMQALSVVFPESYQAFLRDFGGGDAGGEIIFGITANDDENVVTVTQAERRHGLPEKWIVIGFWADALLCLDTGRMQDGECPVLEVYEGYRETEVAADSFGKLLFDYISEE